MNVEYHLWRKWKIGESCCLSPIGGVWFTLISIVRAIFVWPWNENARTKQKQQTNRNRVIWLVYGPDTSVCGFWLVKQTLGWKKLHVRKLSRNQPILHFDIILQHNWPIEQCLLHIRVFLGMKTKSPCFDLFIHWLIKQIMNTYWNHFSRLYKNRSNNTCTCT